MILTVTLGSRAPKFNLRDKDHCIRIGFLPPLLSLLLVFWLLVGCQAPSETILTSEGPRRFPIAEDANVIVISFDALRADALGAYGDDRGATPHMDAFAASSVVFEEAFSPAPVTPASFAGMFTGQWPLKVFERWKLTAPETLATLLRSEGYETAAWINNVHLTPDRGFDRGFAEYNWHRNSPDEDILAEAKAWLDLRTEKKFFLWVHFLRPHAPYRHRPEASHLYRQRQHAPFEATTGGQFEVHTAEELERVRDLYYGEVWTADQLFGDFMAHLRKLGLDQRSIIVLTADHGEEFMEHGGLQHGELYREHLHVPWMLAMPGMKQGERIPNSARTIDLLPTLLSAIGHPPTRPLDGVDWAQDQESLPVIGVSMTSADKYSLSLLEGSFKFILRCLPDRRIPELYNIATDPGETTNLALQDTPTVRRYFQRLSDIMEERPCLKLSRALRESDITDDMDAESVQALKALGYLK